MSTIHERPSLVPETGVIAPQDFCISGRFGNDTSILDGKTFHTLHTYEFSDSQISKATDDILLGKQMMDSSGLSDLLMSFSSRSFQVNEVAKNSFESRVNEYCFFPTIVNHKRKLSSATMADLAWMQEDGFFRASVGIVDAQYVYGFVGRGADRIPSDSTVIKKALGNARRLSRSFSSGYISSDSFDHEIRLGAFAALQREFEGFGEGKIVYMSLALPKVGISA
jgi:hypothetical protein